ncbi:hypothetical protein F5X98DRAFT_383935 [Xylaria grammica]|nr:hypothetical protein F5X98DRAFT_383935 [Xylaria grammica]
MSDPRLPISLELSNGEYYDQIMGMSQGIINSSFEKLYEKYEGLQKINVKIGDGSIVGEMNPPKITIPAYKNKLDQSKVYHQLSFKTGTMKTINGFTLNLDGWIIIIECEMEVKDIPRVPKDGETAADKAEREKFEDSFSAPGDYRVERLYVKLTSANWNKVDDRSRVVNPRTGVHCSYDEWVDDVEEWNGSGDGDEDDSTFNFEFMMKQWTRQLEKNSLTTLGFKLTKPKPDDKATFVPTSSINESYPYYDPDGHVSGDFLTAGTAGNYNCFVYLENVRDRQGPPRILEWTANLAFPAHGNFPETNGSFVLSRQLFMEKFLLPQLQVLNRGTTVYIDAASSLPEGWRFPNSFDQGLQDPKGPSDPKFAFYLLGDETKTAAQYHNVMDKPLAPHQVVAGGDWRRFVHSRLSSLNFSETTVTVQWIPGTNQFEIKGDIHYVRQAYVSSTSSHPDTTNSFGWSL